MREELLQMVARARMAQKELETYSQIEIDALVKAIAKTVFDNAELFAELAVQESGMGNVPSKILKKRGKARIMWSALKDVPTIGEIGRDEEKGIIEIAKPVGIIGGVQPCTNPIVTPMANAMNAIKCRNTMLITPHPRTVNCTNVFLEKVLESWKNLRHPKNILQIYQTIDVNDIRDFMASVDIVVATGGPAMVKSAYSSGKPSFGVGPGNVQCILDRNIDIQSAVKKIYLGRTFDNGIICAGEQTIIFPREMEITLNKELESHDCVIISEPSQIAQLTEVLFQGTSLNKNAIGKSAQWILQKAGITPTKKIELIAVRMSDDVNDPRLDLYRKEKMFPVIALFPYQTFEEAVEIAISNLEIEGKGHTLAIHSHDENHIKQLGLKAPVSRVVVNSVSATSAGGAFNNGLNPTSTLGCGSWGNNSISENFYYKHCLNITRIAMPLDRTAPSDEELWGE